MVTKKALAHYIAKQSINVNKIVLNTDPKSCTYFVYVSLLSLSTLDDKWWVTGDRP